MDAPSSIILRWLGAAGIEIKTAGQTLAIDPFFSRPGKRYLWLGRPKPDPQLVREHLPHCEYVLVTHAHHDHLMDVPEVLRQTNAGAWGSENVCRILRACAASPDQIHAIHSGDRLSLGPYQVHVIPASHSFIPGFGVRRLPDHLQPPLRMRDYRMDEHFGFLIEMGGLRILDWSGIELAGARPAEVLCCIPGGSKLFLQELLQRVRPALIIPIHWDDFFRPLSKPLRPFYQPVHSIWSPLKRIDLEDFQELIARQAPNSKVLAPEIFQSYELTQFL